MWLGLDLGLGALRFDMSNFAIDQPKSHPVCTGNLVKPLCWWIAWLTLLAHLPFPPTGQSLGLVLNLEQQAPLRLSMARFLTLVPLAESDTLIRLWWSDFAFPPALLLAADEWEAFLSFQHPVLQWKSLSATCFADASSREHSTAWEPHWPPPYFAWSVSTSPKTHWTSQSSMSSPFSSE